jgi:hypothetical protein
LAPVLQAKSGAGPFWEDVIKGCNGIVTAQPASMAIAAAATANLILRFADISDSEFDIRLPQLAVVFG